MPYEIRVVFQTMEAYQSAVDRLYEVFGVDVPVAQPSPAPEGSESSERVYSMDFDTGLSEDPVSLGDAPYFVVEDQTR